MNMQVIFAVTSTTSRAGLNFHNCEDRLHIPFFIRSSHIYDFYIFIVKSYAS